MNFTIKLPLDLVSQTVDSLLQTVWLVPKKQRHLLRTKRHLRINGAVPRFSDWVQSGDVITVSFDTEDFSKKVLVFGDAKLGQSLILYEDEHLLIANKPENMKTHGNASGEIALQNHLAAACGRAVYVVHRLDFETSGAVLFAKNPFVLPILDKLLQDREVHRTYQALCSGQVRPDVLTINQRIGTDRHDKKRRLVVPRGGQTAITHVQVIQRLPNATWVACQLDTGRTHQIRVHLSHAGHAILGDALYGGRKANRMMLHAKHLSLRHPFTHEKITVTAPSASFEVGLEKFI